MPKIYKLTKLKYRLEYWRYHIPREKKYFTNKKEAKKYLKENGWWDDFNNGECMIYIFRNNKEIDWEEVKKDFYS